MPRRLHTASVPADVSHPATFSVNPRGAHVYRSAAYVDDDDDPSYVCDPHHPRRAPARASCDEVGVISVVGGGMGVVVVMSRCGRVLGGMMLGSRP